MKPRTAAAAVTIVLFILLSGAALGDELDDRASMKEGIYGLLRGEKIFRHERFARLEAISIRFRETRSRTTSGLWNLTLFYNGVSWAFDANADDDETWARIEKIAEEWLAAFPNSPTPHLAYARMLINRAWAIRGDQYAYRVKPENWQPFYDNVQRARAHLEEHKDVASKDPYWYELMAVIARVQSWTEADFIRMLAEGLGREPLFYQTYFTAIDYYLPKWGGSVAAIEKFAQAALANTKESDGFGMYARVYWYASQTQFGNKIFLDTEVDWPTMKKGIDDVLAQYPDSWNINNFARFACMAQDKEKTAELMRRIGETPLRLAWGSRKKGPRLYQECRKWALGPGR